MVQNQEQPVGKITFSILIRIESFALPQRSFTVGAISILSFI